MSTILKIERIKRSRGWYSVVLEGGEYFAVNEEMVFRERFKEGDNLSEKRIEELRLEGAEKKGREIAFSSLARRERSEKEIRQRLMRRGIEKKAEDKVVSDLKKYDYLDDRNFSVKFVQNYLNRKPAGRKLVGFELSKHGIPDQLKEEVLEDVFSKIDERELARKALEKKRKSYKNVSPDMKKKKISDFLFRRGFTWDLIKETIDEME